MRTLISVCLLLINSISYAAPLGLFDLRCEQLTNPIQIDTPQPRLSWKLKVSDPQARDIVQSAYRILVASSLDLLESNEGDLWDSGRVVSDQSILIPYQGKPLQSRQKCFWKVRVWNGQVSAWSPTVRWQMALLKAADWAGSQWIGLAKDTRISDYSGRVFKKNNSRKTSYPSPLLRKEISIRKAVRRAMAYVSGVGYCELYINGEKVGDSVLDPGQTSYDQHTLYVTHDISRLVKQGDNVLGLWLGNGFYGQSIAFSAKLAYGQPRVRAQFFVAYEDGSNDLFSTSTDWKATVGPIVFDNVYGGESYDARLEMGDWCKPEFNDSFWQPAVELKAPCLDTHLRSQLVPPIRVKRRLPPVHVTPIEESKYLVDFGENIAGWVKIKVRQQAGDVIKVISGEAISADKKSVNTESTGHFATGLIQELYYICKGGGIEEWEPRFTYHGFQYIEISGLRSPPTVETIEGVMVYSDIPRTGFFSCSDAMLNTHYETSLLTLEDNWHSIPEDCPHREKCGWLGDAHATADVSLYSYDMSRFYTKYMRDIEDNLTKGLPTMVAPGKRAAGRAHIDWAVASVLLPWRMYLHTGDADVFRRHYPDMKNLITHFLTFQEANGTIKNGLGDWCPPRWDRQEAPQYMECHPYVSGTAFFYAALQIMGEMAGQFNDTEYSKWCFDKAKEVKAAFNKVYLKPVKDSAYKHYGSQTATVMALKFGMVPEAERESIVKALVYDINTLHGGHHACGIHGLRHLYTVLAENGYEALVYKMLTDTTFPGPAYIVNCGLTTWPERQWEWDKLPEWERSLNHPMQGGFTAFMHESLGGIQPALLAPGYQQMVLKPRLTDQLDWVKSSVESPYGTIRSEWRKAGMQFRWIVEIPANATATIYLPNAAGQTVYEGEKPFKTLFRQVTEGKKQWINFQVGSGLYHFSLGHDPNN